MTLNMPAVTVVIIPGRPIVFIASFLRQFFADADATADSPTEPKHDDGHYNPCANDPLRIPWSTVISIGLDLEKQEKNMPPVFSLHADFMSNSYSFRF